MKILVTVTRGTRAERPSESFLDPSTQQYLTQDPTKDSFIVKECSSLEIGMMEILAMEGFSPLKREAGDGFAVLKYPQDGGNGATELREGSKAQVQYITENDSGVNEYDTLQEAQDFIDTLEPSDGYVLIDEGVSSVAMSSRPSLWNLEENRIGGSPNQHSRADNDRY